jgi:hypothetical protein
MKKSTRPIVQSDSSTEQQHIDNYLPQYIMKWRQGQLFVSLGQQSQQPYMSAFESEQQLVDCLKHSSVQLVCLDPTLGEVALQHWADACKQANKSVFLRGRVALKLSSHSRKQSQVDRQLKQLIDWIVAFLLLIVLSPVILATAILIYLYSPEPIFSRQWHIGTRGKFFPLLKFGTTLVDDDSRTTPLGRWICKYNLDELPQLLNVLRGEISLIDLSESLTVSEAVEFSFQGQAKTEVALGNLRSRAILGTY